MSNETNPYHGRVGFAVGTGRCGTKFLSKVAEREPAVAAVHERNPLLETFHRYCKWYKLPVDDAGFLHTMEHSIREDLRQHRFSLESSAYVSLSIVELYRKFDARFVLLIRSPDRVVNSYLHKGWWDQPVIRHDVACALGYQDTPMFHHFLGRIVPNGDQFEPWQAMSRVGKLGWYWKTLNQAVLDQFRELPSDHYRVVKLEDLNYLKYEELFNFLGIETELDRETFEEIATARPNARSGLPTVHDWSGQEATEFEQQVGDLSVEMSYVYHVDKLRRQTPRVPRVDEPVRRNLGQRILRRFADYARADRN